MLEIHLSDTNDVRHGRGFRRLIELAHRSLQRGLLAAAIMPGLPGQ